MYPKAARTGPYAYAQEVTRVNGRVITRYVGIVRVSENTPVKENDEASETPVTEKQENTATIPANPNRFSRNYSEFRRSETDSETKFLAAGNYYGIHLERNVLALDWSKLRCENCGYATDGSQGSNQPFARTLAEVAVGCPKCSKKALVPRSYAPDLVASGQRKIVVEVYGAKSSVKDAAKMEFYRANGFTAVIVPNEVADNPEWSKPIFQLLALVCGADHPERLFAPEIG